MSRVRLGKCLGKCEGNRPIMIMIMIIMIYCYYHHL